MGYAEQDVDNSSDNPLHVCNDHGEACALSFVFREIPEDCVITNRPQFFFIFQTFEYLAASVVSAQVAQTHSMNLVIFAYIIIMRYVLVCYVIKQTRLNYCKFQIIHNIKMFI